MANFARSLIDTIQHSFLDRLFMRLLSVCGLFGAWHSLDDRFPVWWIFAALALIFALAWIVGTLSMPLHAQGGLSAWTVEPKGGRRPPTFVRGLVYRLGRDPDREQDWFTVVTMIVVMSAVVFVIGLSAKSSEYWTSVHPRLGDVAVRQAFYAAFTGLFTLMMVCSWASEQRRYLRVERQRTPVEGDAWVERAMMLVMLLAAALGVTTVFNWPGWVAVAIAVGVFAVLAATRQSGRAMDWLFGKRPDATGR